MFAGNSGGLVHDRFALFRMADALDPFSGPDDVQNPLGSGSAAGVAEDEDVVEHRAPELVDRIHPFLD